MKPRWGFPGATVGGAGSTSILASQTSRNAHSARLPPVDELGGLRRILFQVSESSAARGGEPVLVPVTGMSHPLTTAHWMFLTSPDVFRPKKSRFE